MKNHKRKPNAFNILPIIILIIFIAVISGVIYFILEKPSSVTCGILLERKDNGDSVDMKLGYDTETKWIKISKKLNIPDGIAYDVKLKGIVVTSIQACKVYTGKVYVRSAKTLLLDNNTINFDNQAYYYRIEGTSLHILPSNSVVIGATNDKFIENKGRIAAVIVSPPDIKSVRVGISNSDFTSYNHQSLVMHTQRGFKISFDMSSTTIKSEYIEVNYTNGNMELLSLIKNKNEFTPDKTIFKTVNRITIAPLKDKPIYIDTLKRSGYSYTPKYYGTLELTLTKNSMSLINDVDVESYLRFVVPSEMPPAGGIEGYKVQAVAARTYVLSEILSGRFAKSGFHVDDTTNCQVYNSQPPNDYCDEAVAQTTGEVLTYNHKIIDAKYYSTSCGVGAPYNQVWYNDTLPKKDNPEPYLSFKNYSSSHIKDLSDNFNAANFLKDWTISSYDSNSPYFRWKYTLDSKTLNTLINHKIYTLYEKNPQNFSKKQFLNFYGAATIPKTGIGNVNDINVSKRGIAGNALELTINSDSGTYKIDKEYNVKRLLVDDNTQITPLYGSTLKNPSPLPSTYYVIDKEMSNNKISAITIYGGGFGHGSGMSQYGVIGLIRHNRGYKDILNIFYKNVVFDNYSSTLTHSLE